MFKIKYVFIFSVLLFSALFLLTLTKGNIRDDGTLFYQTKKETIQGGPFELSNTSSRYALTEAIVQRGSFFLTYDEAKFSAPDVVFSNGKYTTIFTPGVSFFGAPFYFLGQLIGLPQLFTFFSIAIVALINLFLIAKLSNKLGANIYASLLSGFVYVFATNTLGYTLTFTQHQLSSMLLLLAILNCFYKRNLKNNIIFGLIFGAGILMDIPNAILMAPMVLYILAKHINFDEVSSKIRISVKSATVGLVLGLLPLVILFGWYNLKTNGSYSTLAQNIGRVEFFEQEQSPQNTITPIEGNKDTSFILPFQTRRQINGLYILALSDERSWIFYSPVLFIGILGIVLLYKNNMEKRTILNLLIATIALNYILYSMFGDPWGGWAFGARYLIPSAALISALIGVAIHRFGKNIAFIIIFFAAFSYSVYINTLGALTTNAVPPKVEALHFDPPLPYAYEYNIGLIDKNKSGNLLFNTYLNKTLPLRIYWYIFATAIFGAGACMYFFALKRRDK